MTKTGICKNEMQVCGAGEDRLSTHSVVLGSVGRAMKDA